MRPKAKRCADWWERKWKGHTSVLSRGQCKRLTAHPSGYCKSHRYGYRWTEEQEAAYRAGPPLTSPTLPPEAEALVQEALRLMHSGRWPDENLSILRDLARRLLEPGERALMIAEGNWHAADKDAMDARELQAMAEQSLSSLRAELDEARQALWDVYGILGFDQDGDRSPRSVPNVEAIVIEAAKEFRADYDAAVLETGADGWLEKAAEEIAGIAPDESWMPQGVLAVLKRHRDGA